MAQTPTRGQVAGIQAPLTQFPERSGAVSEPLSPPWEGKAVTLPPRRSLPLAVTDKSRV